MRSISEREYIPKKYVEILKRAELAVHWLPDDIAEGSLIRCHELARAVGDWLELDVIDGKFCHVDHSWLLVEDRSPRESHLILDVYAVAQLPQVQLVNLSWHVHEFQQCYIKGAPRKDIDRKLVQKMVDFFVAR
jgi:hypothetical protein